MILAVTTFQLLSVAKSLFPSETEPRTLGVLAKHTAVELHPFCIWGTGSR